MSSDSKGRKKAIEEYKLDKKAFFADKETTRAPVIAVRRISPGPDTNAVIPHQLEDKFDELVEQFVELSLFEKREFAKKVPGATIDKEYCCSLRGQRVHHDTKCHKDHCRSTLCFFNWNRGHPGATLRSKEHQIGNRRSVTAKASLVLREERGMK